MAESSKHKPGKWADRVAAEKAAAAAKAAAAEKTAAELLAAEKAAVEKAAADQLAAEKAAVEAAEKVAADQLALEKAAAAAVEQPTAEVAPAAKPGSEKAPADKVAAPSAVAQLRVRLKYPDLATFVERFAPQLSLAGLFLQSRTPRPVGTRIRFELLLSDGKTRALAGEGVVAWVREPDGVNAARSPGMGVKFSRLDVEGQRMVERIMAFRRERGLRDDSVPAPARADTSTTLRIDTAPASDHAEIAALIAAADDSLIERGLEIARRIIDEGVDDVIAALTAE